ncbi:hypothetical protein NUW54_g11943 [Trametes sanguinea]|uniref:Uncharacterized protein n=1 Tax=Trametes sanguinea TaxID=158606 RepID=A0ACC1N4U7_9APHY|nr:hypothetical protein NUW54_g11943 [Trametes sanguinea]
MLDSDRSPRVLETAHSTAALHFCYTYLVGDYLNLEALIYGLWSIDAYPMLSGLCIITSQWYVSPRDVQHPSSSDRTRTCDSFDLCHIKLLCPQSIPIQRQISRSGHRGYSLFCCSTRYSVTYPYAAKPEPSERTSRSRYRTRRILMQAVLRFMRPCNNFEAAVNDTVSRLSSSPAHVLLFADMIPRPPTVVAGSVCLRISIAFGYAYDFDPHNQLEAVPDWYQTVRMHRMNLTMRFDVSLDENRTDRMLDRIILYSMNTGLLIGVFNFMLLILSATAIARQNVFLLFQVISISIASTKFYTICVLAAYVMPVYFPLHFQPDLQSPRTSSLTRLNTRRSLSQAGATVQTDADIIELSGISGLSKPASESQWNVGQSSQGDSCGSATDGKAPRGMT